MEEPKHVCKFCRRSFPCGRSLGGHMRSHVSGNHSAETERSLVSASAATTTTGYGLREQRKKTWRVSDDSSYGGANAAAAAPNKLCKQCGKGFHSWKALFGHMKCHSLKERASVTDHYHHNNDDNSLEDQDSWTVMDSQSDNEAPRPRTRTRSKRTRTTTASSLSFSNLSSSVSEIEQEQEEVALSLIMLSRGSPEMFSEKKPKRSEILSSDRRSGIWKSKTRKLEFQSSAMKDSEEEDDDDDKEQGKRNVKLLGSELNSNHRRGKFECSTCNKIFDSYQALGGHRASHKKIARDSFVPIDETGENSIKPDLSHHEAISGSDLHEEEDAEFEKSNKNHECSVCLKSFPSGQALDEHKRSHLAEEPVERIRELIDLNVPAEEEGNSECYRSSSSEWWVRSIHNKADALVLSN